MKPGANTQIERYWKLRLCGFYLIFASVSQIENLKREEDSFRLINLYRGAISFRGSGRRQQLLAGGRCQREWSDTKDRLVSRVEKIVPAILSKMTGQLRPMSIQSKEWMFQNLDHELHNRFLQALVLIELHNKSLTGSLNWAVDVHEQLKHIYAGWHHWCELVSRIDEKPERRVSVKQLSFKAGQTQLDTELEIIQSVINDLKRYLAELGIEQ